MRELKCDYCEGTFKRSESRVKQRKNNFCSDDCYHKSKVKYTDDIYAYVYLYLPEEGHGAIAELLGVSIISLVRQITTWRQKGMDVPYLRKLPIGTISTRTTKGVTYKVKKTSSGWKTIERISERRIKKPSPPKAPKKVKEKKFTQSMQKAPRREPDKYKTKIVDPLQVRTVKVAKGTYIQVPVGISDEEAIERYYKSYDKRQKNYAK